MKGHNLWSDTVYQPLLWERGDIYISRLAPGKDRIHMEWLPVGGETSVCLRKREEEDFICVGSTDGTEFDITGLDTNCDYAFYLKSGEKKSAIRLARSMGSEKVGILGFSAGGPLCCGAATRWTETLYPATDTADTLSPRPDFALLIYPAYLDEGPGRTLSPELTVSAHTPPLFVFGTQDDKKYSSTSCINILKAMQEHDAPIEMHYLPRGGHGYGMQGDGAGKIWPVLAERWLEETR